MKYTAQEVIQYTQEEDVKFIRLAFCDVFGKQKNIAIMPDELPRAFEKGYAIEAPSIFGDFGELLLHPDPETLMPLPWRPEHGRVVQMYSCITCSDGRSFPYDTRQLLIDAVSDAKKSGHEFIIGAKQKFYLFQLDEDGKPTKIPNDEAGYMAIAPEDRGENVRREICLTLEQMGIKPESSYHEEGPGQNQIVFKAGDPLATSDNVMTFQRVVKTIAYRNGLYADFSPMPVENAAGNGFYVSVCCDNLKYAAAGILKHLNAMTLFLNPSKDSYKKAKKQGSISCSKENFFELRSPTPTANSDLVFRLMIYAALDGIKNKLSSPSDPKLPSSYEEAVKAAASSDFIKSCIPQEILAAYCDSK